MYKKMVNPLAHGVSKHHLLKEAPESKPSDEVSRSWENATQKALFDKVDDWNSDWIKTVVSADIYDTDQCIVFIQVIEPITEFQYFTPTSLLKTDLRFNLLLEKCLQQVAEKKVFNSWKN